MKLVVLGACADMAKPILPLLAAEDGVERVVLADIAEERVRALAAGLGPRYEAVRTDATDPASLASAVRGAGVVLGYVGPFYRFEAPIAEACIGAGVHYVSIADDYDAYLAVSALHDRARAAGVTVVTGLGNSPGLTNLLAKKGYRSMDRPDRIHIAWTGGSDESVGPANVLHVMHIFEGETLQWRDGREVRVRCGAGEKEVVFPEPIGRQTVFYTGHAESVSVPRNLPGLSDVSLHGGVRPVWVARLATAFGRLGLTTTHERRRALARVLAPVMDLFRLGGSADRSVFRIDVLGTHRGEPRHHWYEGVGRIAEITSFPLLEGALMVARGEVAARGVLAAEAAFDPDDFLPRVERRGVTLLFHEGAELTLTCPGPTIIPGGSPMDRLDRAALVARMARRARGLELHAAWESDQPAACPKDPLSAVGSLFRLLPPGIRAYDPDPQKEGIRTMRSRLAVLSGRWP